MTNPPIASPARPPRTVRDIMTSNVVTALPGTTFPELVDLMLRHDISGLPVIDANEHVVGIVTQADLVCKEAFGGRRRRTVEFLADLVAGGETSWAIKAKGRTAAHVMSAAVDKARPTDDLRATARRLLELGVKRLPVVDDDDRLVGIVSRTDLLKLLHRTDAEVTRDLEDMLSDPSRAPDDNDITVKVEDGVITLSGSVARPDDIPVLTRLAWEVPGTVEVRNEAVPRPA